MLTVPCAVNYQKFGEGDKNKGPTRRMPGASRHHQKDFTFSFDEHSQKKHFTLQSSSLIWLFWISFLIIYFFSIDTVSFH